MRNTFFAVIVFAVLLSIGGAAHAQLYGNAGLILVNAGYPFTDTDASDETKGVSLLASFEKLSYHATNSLGFAFGYIAVQGESEQYGTTNVASIPLILYGKFIFGPKNVKMYVGGGGGVHFTSFTASETETTQDFASGFVLSVPAGIYLTLNENVLINLNYSFGWFSSAFFGKDSVQIVSVGIGFQKF